MVNDEILMMLKNVTKKFPGVTALDSVNLEIKKGEIHGIVGENGAGKSTLCNLMTGIFAPTEGEIYFKGKLSDINHPSKALKEGIAMVYQERNLINNLTGAQNICLGLEETIFGGIVNDRSIRKIANDLMKSVQMNVPIDKIVSDLTPGEMQGIEILRALAHNPELLVLDEPTSSLTRDGIDALFKIIRNIKENGKTIIFISHKLQEVYKICDRITTFRDGKRIGTHKASEFGRENCIKEMVNRDIKKQYPAVNSQIRNKIVFEAKDINAGERVKNINIKVNEGEVVGLYGLVGSGRTEFIETIFGIRKANSGSFVFDNKPLELNHSPRKSIEEGIYLIPEDRAAKGIFDIFNLNENASIVFLKNIVRYLGYVNKKTERKRVKETIDNSVLSVKYKNIEQNIDELSGGNRQKIVILRWLACKGLRLLLLDEPTQGIDVGAKQEIYKFIRQMAEKQNIPMIIISSELPELIGICDRLYIFNMGIISGELTRDEFELEKILSFAI